MGETKKYYWLKLKRDFFKRHDIRIIEAMPNGKDYVLFYLKLMLESVDHEGSLRFSETIPYNEEMLSVVTGTNIDIVRAAMKLFAELKMVEILDDSTIYMNEVQRMIGSATDTESALRQKRYRERKKLAAVTECNALRNACVTKNNESKSIEIDKELETELEIDSVRRAKRFTPPSVDEVAAYCRERGNNVSPERFIDHYTSNGWKVGKNPMKDWKAAVRTWEKSERQYGKREDTGFETGNPFLEMLQEERGL